MESYILTYWKQHIIILEYFDLNFDGFYKTSSFQSNGAALKEQHSFNVALSPVRVALYNCKQYMFWQTHYAKNVTA